MNSHCMCMARKSEYPLADGLPCTKCKLHIKVDTKHCHYCGHELTESEIKSLAFYAKSQKIKGIKIALVFLPIVIILIYLFVSGTI